VHGGPQEGQVGSAKGGEGQASGDVEPARYDGGTKEVAPDIVAQAAPDQPEPGAQGNESNLETLE